VNLFDIWRSAFSHRALTPEPSFCFFGVIIGTLVGVLPGFPAQYNGHAPTLHLRMPPPRPMIMLAGSSTGRSTAAPRRPSS